MAVKALLVDGFGTILDWRASFSTVNEDAYRRAHASVSSLARLPAFAEWFAALHALREEDRRALDPEHRERDYVGRFVKSFAAAGLKKRQARVVGERACARYFQELSASIRLAPDAGPEFWRALPDGLRIGLVSNYGDADTLRSSLDRLGVYYRFDATVITGDVGYLKPHPKVFEAALAELDVAPADALMVGDDPWRDCWGAAQAGIRCALVDRHRDGLTDCDAHGEPVATSEPFARLGSLSELPDLLSRT